MCELKGKKLMKNHLSNGILRLQKESEKSEVAWRVNQILVMGAMQRDCSEIYVKESGAWKALSES